MADRMVVAMVDYLVDQKAVLMVGNLAALTAVSMAVQLVEKLVAMMVV